MDETVFRTDVPMDEIEKRFENFDFFGSLMESLQEAVDYKNGKANSNIVVRKRSIPDVNVATVRHSLNMTQKSFASVLGVSTRTVEAWECGRSNPTGSARKLIFLIQEDHSLIGKLEAVYLDTP